MAIDFICNNFEEIQVVIGSLQQPFNGSIAFRGQSNWDYKLQTRIAAKHGMPLATNSEFKRIMTMFLKKIEKSTFGSYFLVDNFNFPVNNYKKLWQYIFQAQHIGIPTIAMDWSLSYLASLYFACQDENSDGQLWVLNTDSLTYNHDNFFHDRLNPKSLYCNDPYYVNNYFFIRPSFDSDNYCSITPQRRMFYQHGAFLIMPSNNNVYPLESRDCFKNKLKLIKITKSCKRAMNSLFNSQHQVYDLFKDEPFIKELNGKYYKQYNDKFFYGVIKPELLKVVNEIRIEFGFPKLGY